MILDAYYRQCVARDSVRGWCGHTVALLCSALVWVHYGMFSDAAHNVSLLDVCLAHADEPARKLGFEGS